MLYREIIAVCSEIHTKHINTVCGQNAEFVHVKPLGLKGWIILGIIRQRGQIDELLIKRFSSSLHWHDVTTTTLDQESTSEGSERRIFYEAELNSARRSDVCHFRKYQGWHRKDGKCCSTKRNWRNIFVPSDTSTVDSMSCLTSCEPTTDIPQTTYTVWFISFVTDFFK